MKKVTLLIFISIFLNLYAKDNISIVSDPFPPYTICKMGEIPREGVALDIVDELFSHIEGIEVNYMPCIPWKRVLYSTEQGKVDITFPILKNDEREKKYYYSKPVLPAETSMFYLAEKFPNGLNWDTLSDFNNKKICVIDGWGVHNYLEKEQKKNGYTYKIVAISGTGESCFNQLQKKRIDIYATNKTVGIVQIKELGLSKIFKVAKKPLYTKDFYMAFSKKSDAHKFLPEINKIINQMKLDGTTEKIMYKK